MTTDTPKAGDVSFPAVGGREHDIALGQALGLIDEDLVYTAPDGGRLSRGNCDPWPSWTTSLDRALDLAERLLPGWHVTVGNHYSILHDRPGPHACISRPVDDRNYDGETAVWGFGATLPLALCNAIHAAARQSERPS